MKFIQKTILLMSTLQVLAAPPPGNGDVIELTGMINARSSKHYTNTYQNILMTLPSGTKAKVIKVENLPSGNNGLCVQPLNLDESKISKSNLNKIFKTADNPNCPGVWIYFRKSQSHLKIIEKAAAVADENYQNKQLNAGDKVVTKKEIPAIVLVKKEPKKEKARSHEKNNEFAHLNPDKNNNENLVDNGRIINFNNKIKSADLAVAAIDKVNNELGKNLNGQAPNDCIECAKKKIQPAIGKVCKQTSFIDNLISNDPFSKLVQSYIGEMVIKPSCFANYMNSSPGRNFFNCDGGAIENSCVSQNLFELTSNSFNLAASCLKNYNNNSADEVAQNNTSEYMFYLMGHESKFSYNTLSHTGAKGIGQLTGVAIKQVFDTELDDIKRHLNNSNKSDCNKLSAALPNASESPKLGKYGGASSAENNRLKCEYTAIKNKNPVRNIIMSMGYQKHIRNEVLKIMKWGSAQVDQLSPTDYSYLVDQFVMWSYNPGQAFISVLSKALRSHPPLKNRTDIDNFLKNIESNNQFRNIVMKTKKDILGGSTSCLN